MADIRTIRKLNHIPLKDLAEKIGISVSYLNMLENGQRQMTIGLARKFADVFGTDITEFIPGLGNEDTLPKVVDSVKINIIDATACCGNGIEAITENVVGSWNIALADFKGMTNTSPDNVIMLKATGDSMQPTIHDGDWVMVDTSQNFLSSDGVYLIRMANGLAIKRLQAGLVDIRIKSDNPAYDSITAQSGEVVIIGRVFQLLKKVTM